MVSEKSDDDLHWSLNFPVGDKNLQSPPPKMNNFEVWLATIGVAPDAGVHSTRILFPLWIGGYLISRKTWLYILYVFFLILYIIISVFSLQKIYPGPPIYCTILVVLIHPLFPFTSQIDLYHHIPTIATHICFKMPYIPTYSNDLNHSFFVH